MDNVTKFVNHDVPSLDDLCDAKVYKLRLKLNNGEKLTRDEAAWITEKANTNSFFRKAIPCRGWRFDFSDVLRTYVAKHHGMCAEYVAVNKTSLRAFLRANVDYIVEVK